MADKDNPQAGKEGGTPPASGTQTQTTPNQGQDQKPPEGGNKDGQPPKQGADKTTEGKPQGAPEKYSDFKLPEGVSIDKAGLDSFAGLAKDLNLSQEQAQKLVDLQSGMVKTQAASQMAELEATVKTWQEQFKKEVGAKYDEELSFIGKFREQILDAETAQFLKDSRLENHPGLMKAFAKAGRLLREDIPPSGSKSTGEGDIAQALFPSMKK